jgi:hypothetical protein
MESSRLSILGLTEKGPVVLDTFKKSRRWVVRGFEFLDDEILRAGDRRATSRHVQKFRNEKLGCLSVYKREEESKITINIWGIYL